MRAVARVAPGKADLVRSVEQRLVPCERRIALRIHMFDCSARQVMELRARRFEPPRHLGRLAGGAEVRIESSGATEQLGAQRAIGIEREVVGG